MLNPSHRYNGRYLRKHYRGDIISAVIISMSRVTPNLNLGAEYIRENITRWGISPQQCEIYQNSDQPIVYLYLDRAGSVDGGQISRNIRGRVLKQQPDGIYTYIYFTDTTGADKIECSQVVSPSELGTKHVNLLVRAEPYLDTLLLAGELQKNGTTYTINFYSGSTNMEQLSESDNVAQQFVNKFRSLVQLPRTATVRFVSHPFPINQIHTDPDTLRYYEQMGYRLLFFQTATTCRTYRSQVIRLFSHHRRLQDAENQLVHAQIQGATDKIQHYTALVDRLTSQLAEVPKPIATNLLELSQLTDGKPIEIQST
jgi:hypothetical protein